MPVSAVTSIGVEATVLRTKGAKRAKAAQQAGHAKKPKGVKKPRVIADVIDISKAGKAKKAHKAGKAHAVVLVKNNGARKPVDAGANNGIGKSKHVSGTHGNGKAFGLAALNTKRIKTDNILANLFPAVKPVTASTTNVSKLVLAQAGFANATPIQSHHQMQQMYLNAHRLIEG